MAVIRASEFNYDQLANIPIIEKQKRKKNSRSYLDIICAFDIEASRLPDIEQSVMYIWQFQFGSDLTVIGRTWEEFMQMMERIAGHIKEIAYLVIYVHNLSYEFSFLKGIYPFQPEEVFCTDARKVLKCEMMECIEFRCSYYLSNMSPPHPYIEKYNRNQAIVCVGQGAWEQVDTTRILDELFREKGIDVWVDYWGHDCAHDWDWWYKQVPVHLPNIL